MMENRSKWQLHSPSHHHGNHKTSILSGAANIIDHWLGITGQKTISLDALMDRPTETIENTETSTSSNIFTQVLLLLVLISWPLEIAARRKWLSWK
jgi:hypothetical protein